jgi:hypothetical protein
MPVSLPETPRRIAALPRDERGYPAPYFVQWLRDGREAPRRAPGASLKTAMPGYCDDALKERDRPAMNDELVPFENLDQDKVRLALVKLDGNVTEAAKLLKVPPERLRAYVEGMPALRRAVTETMEQGVDMAMAVLFEALRDKMSFQNRYYAAKEFLRSEAGRRRGFGGREPASASLQVQTTGGPTTITLRWIEPPAEER